MSLFKLLVLLSTCFLICGVSIAKATEFEIGWSARSSVHSGNVLTILNDFSYHGNRITYPSGPKIAENSSLLLNFNKKYLDLDKAEIWLNTTYQNISVNAYANDGINLNAGEFNLNFVDPIRININGNRFLAGPELRYRLAKNLFFSQNVNFMYDDYELRTYLGDWQLIDNVKSYDIFSKTELNYEYKFGKFHSQKFRVGCGVLIFVRTYELNCGLGFFHSNK